MREQNTIAEIRAEVLLNFLYPGDEQKWIARNEGTFYRNYNNDLLALDDETREVEMARDSFLKLLPQGVLTLHDDLEGEDASEKYKIVQHRLRILKEAFLPLDSFNFRQRVLTEKMVSELLQEKLPYILKTYFDYDIEKEESPLVREAAVILPFVGQKRGDFAFVSLLLGTLMRCQVNIIRGRYSHTDTTRLWLPQVRFELLIAGLTPEAFRKMDAELEPLRQFICEWLIPVEVRCEIVIKEHKLPQQTNTRLTLGYNTEFRS